MIIITLTNGQELRYELQNASRYLYQAGEENYFAGIEKIQIETYDANYFQNSIKTIKAIYQEFTVIAADPIEGGFKYDVR